MSVTIKIRSRLSSVGDSAPPSESSDGSTSETFEQGSDWHQTEQQQIMTNDSIYSGSTDMHMLSPDTGGAISDNERVQVESFFSGLGTEVSSKFQDHIQFNIVRNNKRLVILKNLILREKYTDKNMNHCLSYFPNKKIVNEIQKHKITII